MKKTVIAVVGCGRIARGAHFPALAQMTDLVRVKYACDLIPEKIEGRLVTSINKEAFLKNIYITSVVIPDTVTTIGINAFWMCSNLKTITIGSGVTTIERSAFRQCAALQTVIYNGTAADWSRINIATTYNDDLLGANITYLK